MTCMYIFASTDTSCGRLLLGRSVVNEVEPYYEDNWREQGDAFSISIYGPQAWCPQISNNMFLMVGNNLFTNTL